MAKLQFLITRAGRRRLAAGFVKTVSQGDQEFENAGKGMTENVQLRKKSVSGAPPVLRSHSAKNKR